MTYFAIRTTHARLRSW